MKSDQATGEVKKSQVILRFFVPTDEQTAKAVHLSRRREVIGHLLSPSFLVCSASYLITFSRYSDRLLACEWPPIHTEAHCPIGHEVKTHWQVRLQQTSG